MGYFPVRYDSRVVIYDRRGFIRLATDAFQLESESYRGFDVLKWDKSCLFDIILKVKSSAW